MDNYYFVSFICTINGKVDYGNAEFALTHPIGSLEDIKNIEKNLKGTHKADHVLVTNFQLLKRRPV